MAETRIRFKAFNPMTDADMTRDFFAVECADGITLEDRAGSRICTIARGLATVEEASERAAAMAETFGFLNIERIY